MNNEGETIIEEYLMLVREKLPVTIADDVINELRSYMQESARDQGDGQITVQSAKKIVAQFGAPGEVADEYKYSMLPETIPENLDSSEAKKEPCGIPQQGLMQSIQPELTPVPQQNPTVSHSSFFIRAVIQSWIWIVIVSLTTLPLLITLPIGPMGISSWMVLVPVSQALIVTFGLLFHSLNLRRKRTILWRRTYQEWSALQNFVTLPEHSIPEAGTSMLRLDVLTSLTGIILFLPTAILGNQPYFLLFSGVPVSFLFAARMYYGLEIIHDDRDPIRNSRKRFAVNMALLVVLEASVFWIFNPWVYGGFLVFSMAPILLTFIVCYGSLLLFNVVSGAQNLWWRTQDEPETISAKEKGVSREDKAELLARLPSTMKRLYAKMIGWIVVYNLPQVYVSFENGSYEPWSFDWYNWIALLIFGMTIAGALLVFYFPYRRFMIMRLDSRMVFGRRGRVEAAVDSFISAIFLAMTFTFILASGLDNIALYRIIDYQRHLGMQWGFILATMELVAFSLGAIALLVRILGNVHEFRQIWKKRAVGLIEQSGVLLVLTLATYSSAEYLKLQVIYGWYSNFYALYMIFLALVLFLAFQIGSSSLKGEMMRRNDQDPRIKSLKTHSVYIGASNYDSEP